MFKKRKVISEINVVPYIDVMLVLLIIFMVTAPLLTQGIKVNLPQAGAEPIADSSSLTPLILSIDAQGGLYINVGDDEEKPQVEEKSEDKPSSKGGAMPKGFESKE